MFHKPSLTRMRVHARAGASLKLINPQEATVDVELASIIALHTAPEWKNLPIEMTRRCVISTG